MDTELKQPGAARPANLGSYRNRKTLTAPADEPTGSWSDFVVVDARAAEDTVMRAAYCLVTASGLTGGEGALAIGGLSRYLDSAIERKGKVTLCLGMIVDTVRAGIAAGWFPEETSRLLLATQQALDAGTFSLDDVAATVKRVRPGATADDVLSGAMPRAGRPPSNVHP